jgi:hypothetical protein
MGSSSSTQSSKQEGKFHTSSSIMPSPSKTATATNSKQHAAAFNRASGICDTILDVIGDTPMVRLHRVTANLECEVLCKCEFFNAGGSVKDRIGYVFVFLLV